MEKWGRRADRLHAAALASHIACCGAPIAFNMLALAFGAGLFAAASPWLSATHDFMHGREVWFEGEKVPNVTTHRAFANRQATWPG